LFEGNGVCVSRVHWADAGFIPYTGTGYQVLIPSKWNPSKEQQVPGVDIRYDDIRVYGCLP
jgi:hypothetical protein